MVKRLPSLLLTSLSDCDQIMSGQDRWNRVSLDRRGNLIAAELDIVTHDGMETGFFKLVVVRRAI